MSLPKLAYCVLESCQILQVSRTILWKLIKTGKLKKISGVGRRVLISHDELVRFINDNTK
jgi:hypothetical protein